MRPFHKSDFDFLCKCYENPKIAKSIWGKTRTKEEKGNLLNFEDI